MALVATPGAATANTYATVQTADAYHASRPSASAWDALDDDAKDTGLLAATQLLDTIKWAGTKGSTTGSALTQALAFPRQWVPTLEFDADTEILMDDFVDLDVAFYSATTIPTPLVRATCELALVMAQSGTTDPFAADAKRVKRKVTGPLETEYFNSQDGVRGLARYPQVLRLVQHMFRDTDGVAVVRS